MLAQAWHLAGMADCLVAVLKLIVSKHVHHHQAVQFFETPDHEPHICGPSCPTNPKPGHFLKNKRLANGWRGTHSDYVRSQNVSRFRSLYLSTNPSLP